MEKIDTSNMASMVRAFPELLGSVNLTKDIKDLCTILGEKRPSGLCIIGMGGSAIAGQYVQALFHGISQLPIITIRDSVLPEFIDKSWVVIAISYSGNTEEAISAFNESRERDCQSFIICAGGILASYDGTRGTVVLQEGLQPRAAFPLLFSAVLQVVECLLGFDMTDLNKISSVLTAKRSEWKSSSMSPKIMATDLLDSVPLFIGSRHLIPVAYRVKCQFNENAKVMAFNSEIPESNHNEIESFNEMNDHTILPVFLRSAFVKERMSRRFDIISEIYEGEGYIPISFSMKSDSKIEEMLLMTFYLDMVSVELAALRGVDSIAVDKISRLKEKLGL